VIDPATTRVELSSHGTLGTGHLFGNRSEGTGSLRNPSAENVRLRVGPYPRTTLITSNLTVVSGRFSCNTRTPKAYVFTTTSRIGIRRDPAKRSRLPGSERRFEIIALHPSRMRSCTPGAICGQFVRWSQRQLLTQVDILAEARASKVEWYPVLLTTKKE
jgi:hypothetical protein